MVAALRKAISHLEVQCVLQIIEVFTQAVKFNGGDIDIF